MDTEKVIADEALFNKLCRIVMITEQRGVRQVDVLLQSFLVRSDRTLMKIFRVVERDERFDQAQPQSHTVAIMLSTIEAWVASRRSPTGMPAPSSATVTTGALRIAFSDTQHPEAVGRVDDRQPAVEVARHDSLGERTDRVHLPRRAPARDQTEPDRQRQAGDQAEQPRCSGRSRRW